MNYELLRSIMHGKEKLTIKYLKSKGIKVNSEQLKRLKVIKERKDMLKYLVLPVGYQREESDYLLDKILDEDNMIEAIKEHEKKLEDREVLVKEILSYFDDGMINSYNISSTSGSFVDIDDDKNYDERLFTQLKELQEIYHLFADDKLAELEDAYSSDYKFFIDDACIYLAEALTNL